MTISLHIHCISHLREEFVRRSRLPVMIPNEYQGLQIGVRYIRRSAAHFSLAERSRVPLIEGSQNKYRNRTVDLQFTLSKPRPGRRSRSVSEMETVLADVANDHVAVVLRPAPPVTSHTGKFWRADGNSPVLAERGGVTVFFSDYQPRGRTFRRRSERAGVIEGESQLTRFIDDPGPQVGNWIEAVWRDPAGALRGWYHAEERAPCPATALFLPHIGEVISRDDGPTWRCSGELLRAPPKEVDCGWRNGFFAGGVGDFRVMEGRSDDYLYLPFTSYLLNEDDQGIVMARFPTRRPAAPAVGLELGCADGWREAEAGRFAKLLWRIGRGWRHADPHGFWGPAVHFNEGLGAYVMLLNRTAGGSADLVQEGIYVSANKAIDDPEAWSEPLKLVQGGAWYPQVVGLEEGHGDTRAGSVGRFFMGGFSAWEIDFSSSARATPTRRPLCPSKADFAELFGQDKRCPW